MTIVSDATIWSVTFDAARGVIYDRNMAIPHVYGTGVICDDRNSFIIQATDLSKLFSLYRPVACIINILRS